MKETFRLKTLHHQGENRCDLAFLSMAEAEKIRCYHATFPMYEPTPLVSLEDTARELGLGSIYVKDESRRFGLNAFKVLGGSYAIGHYLADKLGVPAESISSGMLTSPETKRLLGDITFITATDGNHGRGVAWTATQVGMRSVVYMPKGSAKERLNNIIAAGADASITEVNYDDTVRLARAHAEKNGWVLVQDTSWEGYEEIPRRIMQGYCTMGLEALEQMPEKPTHVFLQAGVGSMAGAVAGLLASAYGEERPKVIIVEPNKADCIFRTAEADDGTLRCVGGDMDTIMAGLACGEPCSLAWDILRYCADHFVSCPDYVAAKGMRILGNPAGKDQRIISGESGASAFGCAAEIMTNPQLAWMRDALELNEHVRVLFFSTEGDTDKANYRAIVWDGRYSAE
ncbi:MAG: diaminopropionate ammonia-lyase [Clostridia bacterium]|nr:diaminopropionate ammonia-lyase [Clostridia bacterium]